MKVTSNPEEMFLAHTQKKLSERKENVVLFTENVDCMSTLN